jgi:hypothetical protein
VLTCTQEHCDQYSIDWLLLGNSSSRATPKHAASSPEVCAIDVGGVCDCSLLRTSNWAATSHYYTAGTKTSPCVPVYMKYMLTFFAITLLHCCYPSAPHYSPTLCYTYTTTALHIHTATLHTLFTNSACCPYTVMNDTVSKMHASSR